MNRKRKAFLALVSAFALIFSSFGSAFADEREALIKERISKMTLQEKVGQMFMVHVYGESVDDQSPENVKENQALYGVDNAAQLIEKYHLGGIAYFNWTNNANHPEQIARLSNGIQKVAMQAGTPIPMLIAVDQEQGIVARIKEPATQFPGNMALGAMQSDLYAYLSAKATGEELRGMGINMNFAPVADVNVNPANPVIGVRSFSSDSELVSKMVSAQVKGYQAANIAAVAKHFPGHGDTDVDSHTGLPIITYSEEEWKATHLPPFQAAIENGADVVMTAHIVLPSLDGSGRPATLSKPILTGWLREKLGFNGVVVTDALTMEAVREKFGEERVPVEAIEAGVDILLMPPNLDLAYQSILNAVKKGTLSEERIDQSVYRILKLKEKLGLNTANEKSFTVDVEHQQLAEEIAKKSVTLVKNEGALLPLDLGKIDQVLVTGYGEDVTKQIAARLGEYGVGVQLASSESSDLGSLAEKQDAVIVSTFNVYPNSPQQKLVQSLLDTGKPVIVVAVRNPYDISAFPEVDAYLATYSTNPKSLEAAVDVIIGQLNPMGNLPVEIPGLYPFGHGLR